MVDQYIIDSKTYLPDFLKESSLILNIMDCLNVLISKEDRVFEQIQQAYFDFTYKNIDYSKLGYEAKISIIHELGFDYLLDILNLTSEQLTQLLIFFNLIYILKGKKEGLKLVLDTLGIVYTYVTWDETTPRGPRFTAQLNIVGNEYANNEIFAKIRNFVRSYMLPWVNITVQLTIDAPNTYIYPSVGIITRLKYTKIFSTIRDVADIAVYDSSKYDINSYATNVTITAGSPMPDFNYGTNVLTIKTKPEDAVCYINNVKTNVAEVERGSVVNYKVVANNKTKQSTIVINQNKTLTIDLT